MSPEIPNNQKIKLSLKTVENYLDAFNSGVVFQKCILIIHTNEIIQQESKNLGFYQTNPNGMFTEE